MLMTVEQVSERFLDQKGSLIWYPLYTISAPQGPQQLYLSGILLYNELIILYLNDLYLMYVIYWERQPGCTISMLIMGSESLIWQHPWFYPDN